MKRGDEIKKARKSRGWTQTEMAEKIGIALGQSYSLRQYQRLESGEFPKFKREVTKVVDSILGTSLHDTLYDETFTTKNDVGNIEGSSVASETQILNERIRALLERVDGLEQENRSLLRELGKMEQRLSDEREKIGLSQTSSRTRAG